jgi:Ser-tRNA(Ala) deacylase AlaX
MRAREPVEKGETVTHEVNESPRAVKKGNKVTHKVDKKYKTSRQKYA